MSARTIYDVMRDSRLIASVGAGSPLRHGVAIRNGLGTFGSPDWWSALVREGVIRTSDGTITRLLKTGHGSNFPEVEIETGFGTLRFEKKGEDDLYRVGQSVRVQFALYGDLFSVPDGPLTLLRDVPTLLRLEALD